MPLSDQKASNGSSAQAVLDQIDDQQARLQKALDRDMRRFAEMPPGPARKHLAEAIRGTAENIIGNEAHKNNLLHGEHPGHVLNDMANLGGPAANKALLVNLGDRADFFNEAQLDKLPPRVEGGAYTPEAAAKLLDVNAQVLQVMHAEMAELSKQIEKCEKVIAEKQQSLQGYTDDPEALIEAYQKVAMEEKASDPNVEMSGKAMDAGVLLAEQKKLAELQNEAAGLGEKMSGLMEQQDVLQQMAPQQVAPQQPAVAEENSVETAKRSSGRSVRDALKGAAKSAVKAAGDLKKGAVKAVGSKFKA